MLLSPRGYEEFLKTHLHLLYYVGKKTSILLPETTFDTFYPMDSEIKLLCRDALNSNSKYIDDYVFEFSNTLSVAQIVILNGLKVKVSADFVVFRYLAKSTVFYNIDDKKFYSVKALGTPFHNMLGSISKIITMTLIRHKEGVIYDGFVAESNIKIGKNLSDSLDVEYQSAKRAKQIIRNI